MVTEQLGGQAQFCDSSSSRKHNNCKQGRRQTVSALILTFEADLTGGRHVIRACNALADAFSGGLAWSDGPLYYSFSQ